MITSNDKHPSKAEFSILFTDKGMIICEREMHPKNENSHIFINDVLISVFLVDCEFSNNSIEFSKLQSSSLVSSENKTCSKVVKFSYDFDFIIWTFDGIVIFFMVPKIEKSYF